MASRQEFSAGKHCVRCALENCTFPGSALAGELAPLPVCKCMFGWLTVCTWRPKTQFLRFHLPRFLRQSLLLTQETKQAGHEAPRICLSASPELG